MYDVGDLEGGFEMNDGISDIHLLELIAGLLLFVILPLEWVRMRKNQARLKELDKDKG